MAGATQDALSKEVGGRTERVLVLTGKGAVPVQVDCDDTQFFADFAEIYPDSHRIVATGNVKVGTPTSFITAERVEFDTKARTGMFYQAHGMASLGDRVDKSMFGTQEADAIFRGREIHKLGPKKYKIVDGAFTTCVQPTPRWEVVSGSSHAQSRRLRPAEELGLPGQGRAADVPADVLLPDSGGRPGHRLSDSHLRHVDAPGQSLSNAFFWAISRSQDATFVHDWFSKAGQQMGGEYRYILSGGSQGNARVSFLDEKATDATTGETTSRRGAAIRSPAG